MPRLQPILMCMVLATVAFLPALFNSGLPNGADVAIHYWRTFDLQHSWAAGDLTARWSELYYYGYGAPSFQYTGFSFYGLAVLAGQLPFVDDVARLKIIWWLGLFLASWGMWRFVRRRYDSLSAYVSAAAFVFAPVVIFHEPLARGSLGVVFGMGCLIVCLSYLDQISQTGRGILGATLSLLGLLLAHNLTAISGTALLGAWLVWQSLFSRHHLPHLKRAWGAFLLGCGLGTFFWIPVLLERDLVRVGSMGTNDHLDFRRHFQPLATLLAFPQPFDLNLYNNAGHPQLGFFQWLVAAVGAGWSLIRGTYRKRSEAIFWMAVALTSVLLVLPQGAFLWEQVPLLQQFLFPLRFLNIAAIALAILCGIATHHLLSLDAKKAVSIVAVGIIWMIVAQGLHIAGWTWRDFPSVATVEGYFDYERTTGVLGGTADNEFLPPTVRDVPGKTDFLMDSLASDQPAQRLNPFIYPDDTTIEIIDSAPTRYAFRIDTTNALTLEVLQIYFPGWRAFMDRQPLTTGISDPYGFILLDIPAGQHTIELIYPLTTPQTIGWVVTGICGVLILLWLRRDKYRADERPAAALDEMTQPHPTIIMSLLAGTVLLGALHGAGILGYITSPAGTAYRAHHPLRVDFDDVATFLGYDVQPSLPNQTWRAEIFWHFPTEQAGDINGWIHVLDERGEIIAQHDKLAINAPAQSAAWQADWHLRDTYILIADVPIPPQRTQLRVGLWRCLDDVNTLACQNRELIPIITTAYENPDGWFVIDMTP